MRRTRLAVLVVSVGAAMAVGILVLLSGSGASSSAAQQGLMQNCPEAGAWAISVWSGDDGTEIGEALDTCGEGAVSAAYSLDPLTQDWLRSFPGRPEVSNLLELDNLQGIIALGAASAATPTATATPTPSTSATPIATETPTATAAETGTSGGGASATPTATATPYSDRDADGLGDMLDNCPFDANPDQENTYCTELGDACDCYFHDGICWYAGGMVLVGFDAGTSLERAEEIVIGTGATIKNCYDDPTWCSVRVPYHDELEYIQLFAGFGEVRYADLNHILEID